MAHSIFNLEQDDELTRYLFQRAAKRGFLEPVVDRDGKVTEATQLDRKGFNQKHLTALRQIAGHPHASVSEGRLLRWANANFLNHCI